MRTVILLLLIISSLAVAQPLVVHETLVHPRESLSIPALEAGGIERALAAGTWTRPMAGEAWHSAVADSGGWIQDEALIGGYAYATVTVDRDTTLILEAMGYQGVLVNGEPRVGNIYGYTDQWESWQPHFDFSYLPVRLHRGTNELLFFGNRYGLMRARLHVVEGPLQLNPHDTTLPDLVAGEAVDTWGAIVVMNTTGDVVTDAVLEVKLEGAPRGAFDVPPLPPFGVRKVGFPIRGDAPSEKLRVAVIRHGETQATTDLKLAVKAAHENRRVTFVSEIDGSVQYYGYLPARGEPGPKALVLSLHGASVEALNQSGSYAPLTWGHVVAPTNRRPFGFNWEDWGRLDALEVLDLTQERLDIAPDRVYLTGHSMGGHGSWHVATLHPDRFAAVGPSAGWVSFWSYRPDRSADANDPLAAMLERATLSSRTMQTAPNLAGLGVYVLHGAADQTVKASEAHAMLERLDEFHDDYAYHEQPEAGHWWDLSDDPGADCVAWAPMFDFFARHRLPQTDEVREISFLTPSPGVSAWHHWVCVAAQEKSFVMSSVEGSLEPINGLLRLSTENVAVLGLDLAHVEVDTIKAVVDGDELTLARPADGQIWLEYNDHWHAITAPDPQLKGLHRQGGFREAFGNKVQLVYATGGTHEENAWALAKARYDAEHLWYQGNGSVDVIPDTMLDPNAEPDRNVILYGNADIHAQWSALWTDEAVTVARGHVSLGDRAMGGEGFAVLAVKPRPGSDVAVVGIIAGTGPAGCRLTDRRPYLAPGIAYPDVTIFEDRGDGRVLHAAGFFGNDWSVGGGEFVWADRVVDSGTGR